MIVPIISGCIQMYGTCGSFKIKFVLMAVCLGHGLVSINLGRVGFTAFCLRLQLVFVIFNYKSGTDYSIFIIIHYTGGTVIRVSETAVNGR